MAAISKKPWSSIKKSMLPRSAFLIQGDPQKKTTWRLPVYEGTGPLDSDGCYTQRGPLNINGVKAAWAAVNGAHTGEEMTGVPSSVIAKLKRWKAQYFPSDESKQAMERAMEGRVSRKLGSLAPVDDLLDDEDREDEDEDEALTLADGKPAKGSAAMKAKMAALRAKSSLKIGKKAKGEDDAEDSEDDAELAEDDEAEQYDDSSDAEMYDDGEPDDGQDEMLDDSEDGADDDVDPEEDEDEGDGEEDEPPAPKAKAGAKRGGKQMSKRMGTRMRASEQSQQPSQRTLTLAEQRTLTEENARLRYKLFEMNDIEKTLAGWKAGRFQFKENAKSAPKSGRITLSKAFSEAFRAWMRSEGVRLSETSRTRTLALFEIALSSAVVDLSERGSSYDPEGRMVALNRRSAGDDDRLQQAAERIALSEEGKGINALTDDPAKVLAIYSRAAEQMRY